MSNFYLIYGDDNGLIENQVTEIINKLNINKDNIVTYSLNNTSMDDIILEASMFSMFGTNKVIVINDANCFKDKVDNIEVLEEYFEKYNHDNYLIFTLNGKPDTRKKVYKLMDKMGSVIAVKNDRDYLYNYVNKYIIDNNYQMSSNNIIYFLSKVGSDINNIKNELDKLMIYKDNDHNILKEDIDEMVIVNIDDEIFALTDAVINGDISNSMRLYNFFINHNYEQVQIIALLGSQFHFLFQVKRLYNQGKYKDDIAKILEVHPYRVKLALGKIYSYSEELLLSYISKLADMDKNIKLGKIDKGLALELFLINKDM